MFRFILFVLALAGGLAAQETRSCPDQIVERVDPVISAQYLQTCGTNLSTTVGGVSITTPINICPLLVIIRPGHDTTRQRPGSGTLTRPVKTVAILALNFECENSWFLGIIPIVVSSSCVAQGQHNIGVVTHYEQLACRGEGKGSETDQPGDTPKEIH